jgi:hypothetical protein
MTAKLEALEKRITEQQENLRQLKARKQLVAAQIRTKEAKVKRAADNQRKYEVGGLVVLAGLAEMDKGMLLGLLLGVAETYCPDAPEKIEGSQSRMNAARLQQFKAKGDALLAERERSRKASKAT